MELYGSLSDARAREINGVGAVDILHTRVETVGMGPPTGREFDYHSKFVVEVICTRGTSRFRSMEI
jgi:hypothetical protein